MTSDWEADRDAWGLTAEQYRRYLQVVRRYSYELLMLKERRQRDSDGRRYLLGIAVAVTLVMTLAVWLVS